MPVEEPFYKDLSQKVKFSKETQSAAREIFHFHKQTRREKFPCLTFVCGWLHGMEDLGFCGTPCGPLFAIQILRAVQRSDTRVMDTELRGKFAKHRFRDMFRHRCSIAASNLDHKFKAKYQNVALGTVLNSFTKLHFNYTH